MAWFGAARRRLCAAAPGTTGRWEKLKRSKAGAWCSSLLSDYREACMEALQGARTRPLRASLYLALLGGAGACFHTRPDQAALEAVLLERSNQLALLSPWIRSAASDGHVQSLARLRNEGRLCVAGLGLVAVAYRADYDGNAALYEARCSDLGGPWGELPRRVLDVGFWGRWWVLDSKMKDYDINEDEFRLLPAHMQATRPPSVQEVERNERLHRESWLPPPGQEEEREDPPMDRKDGEVAAGGGERTQS